MTHSLVLIQQITAHGLGMLGMAHSMTHNTLQSMTVAVQDIEKKIVPTDNCNAMPIISAGIILVRTKYSICASDLFVFLRVFFYVSGFSLRTDSTNFLSTLLVNCKNHLLKRTSVIPI